MVNQGRAFKQGVFGMKRSYKIAIIAIVHLIFLYTLCFAGNAIMYGFTWLNAWAALKTLGISLGITAIIFIIGFLSHKWLEE